MNLRLTINDIPCNLNIIKDCIIHFKYETSDNIPFSIIKKDVKFSHKEDYEIEIKVPIKLEKIHVEIKGKILNLQCSEIDIFDSKSIGNFPNQIIDK